MKRWFITGASSGLGLGMTERLLQRGDAVVATARRVEALAALQASYPSQLSVEHLDVTDTAAVRRIVDAAFANGRVDVVVSNAGYGLFGAAEELSDLQIDRQIATNLTASVQLIRAVLPHLRVQGGGRVLQVSSEGGQMTYPAFSLYHATKWGSRASSTRSPRKSRHLASRSHSSSRGRPIRALAQLWIVRPRATCMTPHLRATSDVRSQAATSP
ncbi:SDR family NAD(P)-dependent oxidoreductase [Sphingomonas sp. RHCKR7]|nr:SDR family NAD(P)-dependent oxidoreductase [Sphingomonas folli]